MTFVMQWNINIKIIQTFYVIVFVSFNNSYSTMSHLLHEQCKTVHYETFAIIFKVKALKLTRDIYRSQFKLFHAQLASCCLHYFIDSTNYLSSHKLIIPHFLFLPFTFHVLDTRSWLSNGIQTKIPTTWRRPTGNFARYLKRMKC